METKKVEGGKKANFLKNKTVIAALVVIGVLIGWEIGIRAYFYYIRPYFSGMAYRNYVDAYIQLQLNDKIGGDTPEETVDLFIEALKKGDYDLASKYFVIDDQEKWKKTFTEMKDAGRGQGLIDELENAKKIWRTEKESEYKFVIKYNTGTGEEEITNFIVLKKNLNDKWKIGGF
ncbi:DUF4878 domain-containing protein [Patescibacteria group bacterium]|nr:DUF4878 domain-containing protein [Patescibacteria group bacterium]